ncbi:MAG: UTP--glucose-1-phosphate uridylyltransferase [Flammeovirgaceae bacterium]|nr:UTP--glucose-1-phosphate uridylyltransferase [Flammeovirgaceae bacterium]
MSNKFIATITSQDPEIRNQSFFDLCKNDSIKSLAKDLDELEKFRRTTENLYERVRACLFLYAGYRFVLADSKDIKPVGKIPYDGFECLLARKFEQAIIIFRNQLKTEGLNATILSGLANSYHQLSFQILADQVRKSVRSSKGNQWMFRVGNKDEHPIKIHPRMMKRESGNVLYPILMEKTSVRMDLSHSGWSDIFFLGMDYPEGARVCNVSIDLGVYKRDKDIKPPIESYLRVISEPVIRVTSLDLNATKDISDLSDLFNFGNDYLSLLKAGIIASGVIPPSFEGTNQSLENILEEIVGKGMGFELVTKVNDIPKGSRFAVSTNLLASMISVLMRATNQTKSLEGPLEENERRLAASRAILGEWVGGSGGGWQDSGGIWPGIKAIEGTFAKEGDPEYGISRGCLLPKHRILKDGELHPEMDERLASSLVLMHGGMASNVGPILEMVTEKYLLRSSKEWVARQNTNAIFDDILAALKAGDINKLATSTQKNWDNPIKTIIPWASTHFTEVIINKAKQRFKDDYLGFLMLGGMSGGGMGMFVNPEKYTERKDGVLDILMETKEELKASMPFAMEPVVYNFKINKAGTSANLLIGESALMPNAYYNLQLSTLSTKNPEEIPYSRRAEMDFYTVVCEKNEEAYPLLRTMVSSLFRVVDSANQENKFLENEKARKVKEENGFDFIQHEQIREDLRKGRIGLSRNRLPVQTSIEDVKKEDIVFLEKLSKYKKEGEHALKKGEAGIFSLAAGVGSRWTKGAGVIKALNQFIEIDGEHRSFLEIHLGKTKKVAQKYKAKVPHIVATSYLTQSAIESQLELSNNFGYDGPIYLSAGRSIGQRFIPMERDLRFLWEETPQETLDENKQKVRDAVRKSLIGWAKEKGEASDYEDNLASQRFSPLGHWYEISNMLRNGTLAKALKENPNLQTLMLHNIDTLGADLNPDALGHHLASGNILTFEVVPRRIEDRGGGLARVNGKTRLLEGLAQPREEDELNLSYYNSMTTWIQIDPLLALFGLKRKDLNGNQEKLDDAVRKMAQRMPTYVTIKDVKFRWGHGQEDIYPVAQIEKLWSDMSALSDVPCGYVVVPRFRGQQMKDPAQLDEWVNDGSKVYIENLCKID